MRISDWSSDVCSSDLIQPTHRARSGKFPRVCRSCIASGAPDPAGSGGTIAGGIGPEAANETEDNAPNACMPRKPATPGHSLITGSIARLGRLLPGPKIGRAKVRTPGKNAQHVYRI